MTRACLALAALAALAVLAVPARAGEPPPGEAELLALGRAGARCDRARKHCIGIRLHVAVDTAGAPVATPDWVARQLAVANKHFAAIGVAFQVAGASGLPESAAHIEDAAERTSLAALVSGTVIDLFVTEQLDDIDVPGNFIYGVAWPTGAKKFVILSTRSWERTLAHELGHVFGLPHSRYAISIMNKRERKSPPLEQRTFHRHELAVMRGKLAQLLRDKLIAHMPPVKVPVNGPISAPLKARP